jgi:hypothetical protein
MSNNDKDKLNEQALLILHEYDELKEEIHSLLKEDKLSRTRIRGAISSAGVAAENMLLYMIKKSGRADKLEALKPNQRGMGEYKRIVEDLIPRTQTIHLGTIIPWRNNASHPSETHLTEDELKAVEVALNSLTKWFFETYLNGEYADFKKNTYAKKDKPKEPTNEELDEIKKNFEKNPLNIPDFSILKQSKHYKNAIRRKKQKTIFIILLIFCSIAYLVYHFYIKDSNNKAEFTIASKTHLNKNQVLSIIRKYNDSYNDLKFDAHKYFANYVDHYITDPNINNPTEIEIVRKTNMEYIDPRSSVDSTSLVLVSKNDSISYWQFSGENVCYRPSKKKFQKCNVLMEYGINTEGRITRIKQIRYWNLQYTKNRPN